LRTYFKSQRRYTAQAYFVHQRYLKEEATKLAKATSTEKKSAVSVMLAETTGEATQEDIAAVDEELLAEDSDSRDSLLDQDAAVSECSTSEEMLDGMYSMRTGVVFELGVCVFGKRPLYPGQVASTFQCCIHEVYCALLLSQLMVQLCNILHISGRLFRHCMADSETGAVEAVPVACGQMTIWCVRCDKMRLGSAEEAADEPDFDSEAYGYTDKIRYHDHIRDQIAGVNEMRSSKSTKAAAARAETAAPPAAVAGPHMEVMVKLGPKSAAGKLGASHVNRTLINRLLPKVQLFNSLLEYVNTLLPAIRVCHHDVAPVGLKSADPKHLSIISVHKMYANRSFFYPVSRALHNPPAYAPHALVNCHAIARCQVSRSFER
jgi:hypothetical protein